jgi:chromosome partitioning protein
MDCKVITIAQQKGGAGKTTLAAHLAVCLQQQGKRVAVIDIDPQGSLTEWHRIREERYGEGYTGINFNALSGWRIGSEISRLQRNFDIVIIDSPPHTETEARTAIRNADAIVIPVQPSPTDLWATKATIELAKNEKIPYITILNRVSANSRLAEIIGSQLSNLAKGTLGNRVAFAASIMEGRTVTETAPKSPAADEIKKLAKEIMKIFKQDEENEENVESKSSASKSSSKTSANKSSRRVSEEV